MSRPRAVGGTPTLRGLVTAAVALVLLSGLPLAGIALVRLHQIRAAGASWSRLAEASRWLAVGSVCGGAQSSAMAQADLDRWAEALRRVEERAAGQPELEGSARALLAELRAVRAGPAAAWQPWVASRCDQVARLAEAALSLAVRMGNDPASRPDRFEDLATRDVVAYAVCWCVGGLLVLVWVRRRATLPLRRLSRVLERVAAGDSEADIPEVGGGEVGLLATELAAVLERFEREARLRRDHLQEQRNLIRQLIELVDEPTLVVGVSGTIDFANGPAGAAFGEECQRLEGCPLRQLEGGARVAQLVSEVVGRDVLEDEPVSSGGTPAHVELAASSVVRDAHGEVSRVVLVFRAGTSFWRRLLDSASR